MYEILLLTHMAYFVVRFQATAWLKMNSMAVKKAQNNRLTGN